VSTTRLRVNLCAAIGLAAVLAPGCGVKRERQAHAPPTPLPPRPAEADTGGDEGEALAETVKATGDPMITDAVYVIVDTRVITVNEVLRKVEPIVDRILEGRPMPSQKELEALRTSVFISVSEGMIVKALILKAAAEKGMAVDETRVGSQIKRVLLRENLTLEEYLEKNKLTYRELYREVRDDVLFSGFRQIVIVPRVHVAPGEVVAYFEEHKDEFSQLEQVECRQIVFFGNDDEKRQKAESAVEKLRAGATFAEVAKEFSESSNAEKGGAMGWIERDRVINSKKVNTVLFDELKVGEPSGVIEDEGHNLWIVMITGRREPIEADIQKAWPVIEQRLLRTKREDETWKYARGLAKTTAIVPEEVRERFLRPPEEPPR